MRCSAIAPDPLMGAALLHRISHVARRGCEMLLDLLGLRVDTLNPKA